MIPIVHTARLDLTPLAAEAIDALLAGDAARLHHLTGARFRDPAPPPYMADALPVVRERLRTHPSEAEWWNWLIVERETGEAVGSVAFAGPVNAEGAVLVGYAMYAGHEGRGYATEAVKAMVAWAFAQPGVREVRALAPGVEHPRAPRRRERGHAPRRLPGRRRRGRGPALRRHCASIRRIGLIRSASTTAATAANAATAPKRPGSENES